MAVEDRSNTSPRGAFSITITRRTRRRIGLALAYAVLCLWAAMSAFPVFWTYISSIKPAREVFQIPPVWVFTPTLHHYEVVLDLAPPAAEEVEQTYEAMGRSRLPQYFLNTLIVTLGSTSLAIIVGSWAGYALARARFRGRRLILISVLLSSMIPPIVLVIPFYLIWRELKLLDTHLGLIIAFFAFALPFVIWMARGFFLSLPAELEEAAMIDGCSRWGALFRIVLPLAAPGIAATALFVGLFVWNEFLVAAVIGGESAKMLTPAIYGYVSDNSVLWGRLYAASGLVMLPVILFTVFIQRHITTGLTAGAVKG